MALQLDRWPIREPLSEKGQVSGFWQFYFTNLTTYINYLLTGTQSGEGSPEGVVTAPQGSLYRRTDGSTNTSLYVKTSGGVDPAALTDTGWVAK
jgi:hypothetical protein